MRLEVIVPKLTQLDFSRWRGSYQTELGVPGNSNRNVSLGRAELVIPPTRKLAVEKYVAGRVLSHHLVGDDTG